MAVDKKKIIQILYLISFNLENIQIHNPKVGKYIRTMMVISKISFTLLLLTSALYSSNVCGIDII